MRFFTEEWTTLEDKVEAERVVADYNRFLASLDDGVGAKIRQFLSSYNLNDALLDRLEVNSHSRVVKFDLVEGENARGYRLLRIRYTDARIVGAATSEVADAIDRRSTDIRYDEFDIAPERSSTTYVHRFLLWPADRAEFGIEFRDFSFSARSLSGRRFETYGETFTA